MAKPVLLDCTLRDGGYYNKWDFPVEVINDYLYAMSKVNIDVVEIGFRSSLNNQYKGACAYSRDDFLRTLVIPSELLISVMVNASELVNSPDQKALIQYLFPHGANESQVSIVRIACNYPEIELILPSIKLLSGLGFKVVINLMQIFGLSKDKIEAASSLLLSTNVEVLYFADSRGCMNPSDTASTVSFIKQYWNGHIGIHTHDNMGNALANTLCAYNDGVGWLDSTVTGMGRGPGNARTEELVIEIAEKLDLPIDLIPLMNVINSYFYPLKNKYRWGTNPYYYLAGKYKIHPSFVQQMLSDVRFDEANILAVIDSLRNRDASKFNQDFLKLERDLYNKEPVGSWNPASELEGRKVLFIGPGESVQKHLQPLRSYIKTHSPYVISLNAISSLDKELVDASIACHPVRLLADMDYHSTSSLPLITPYSMLSPSLKERLISKEIYDFGLAVLPESFEFNTTSCVCPSSLVLAYALALCVSGCVESLALAGFDGYTPGDPRNDEVEKIFDLFVRKNTDLTFYSVTPTSFKNLPGCSIYGI